jgi:hypothetical protein
MAETQDVKIRLTADVEDAKRKLAEAKTSFTELNQALELAQKGAAALRDGFALATEALERGGRAIDISQSFDRLTASAGKTASVFLNDLRKATEGAISNTDLMSLANKALSLNLEKSGVSFTQVAENVRILAKATGVDAKEAIDSFTQAMATGRTMALNSLGVTVDLEKATQDYARSIGKTSDQLNDSQRKLAAQRAASEALETAVKNLKGTEDNAGDAAEAFGATIQNLKDDFAEGFASSTEFKDAIKGFNEALKTVDLKEFGKDLGEIAAFLAKTAKAFIDVAEAAVSAGKSVSNFLHPLQGVALEAQKAIDGLTDDVIKNAKTTGELPKIYQDTASELEKVTQRIDELKTTGTGFYKDASELTALEKQQVALTDNIKKIQAASEDAKKALPIADSSHPIIADGQDKKVSDLTKELEDLRKSILESAAQGPLELAQFLQDPALFTAITNQLSQSSYEGFRQGLQKFVDAGLLSNSEAASIAQQQSEQAIQKLRENYVKGITEDNTKVANDLTTKLKQSADFFSDFFYDTFTGKAFDAATAFKKVLSGVLGGALGSLFPGAGQFGNLQGLGQAIGANLLGSTALGSVGGLFGGGAVGGAIGQNLDGSLITAGGAGAAGGLGAALTSAAPIAAVTASLALAASSLQDIAKGNKLSSSEQFGLALPTFGASLLANPIISAFGSGKSGDQKLHDEIRKQLQDSSVLDENFSFNLLGTGGKGNLGAEKFQGVKISDFLGPGVDPKSKGLVSGIADIFTGGNGKLSEDFKNMLANIVSGFGDATNATKDFNLILANTAGLLDQMNITADQAKDQLKNMFLDGKISIDEFAQDIQGLNQIAQDNLVGKGSIKDALNILANNFDNPRNELKGLELLFNEAKELGITDISDLGKYIESTLGIHAADTFQKFETAGIHSFQDLQNASADQIFLIISGLNDLKSEFYDTFDISNATNAFDRNSSRIVSALSRTRIAAGQAADAQRKLNGELRSGASAASNGGNQNPPLNKNKP